MSKHDNKIANIMYVCVGVGVIAIICAFVFNDNFGLWLIVGWAAIIVGWIVRITREFIK